MNKMENSSAEKTDTLDERQMRSCLQAFYHWYEHASTPSQQCSRSRVLFLCLLIRFAALRLGEALVFNDMEDIDANRGIIHVRGKWGRILPLPASTLKRLLELRDCPCNVRIRGEMCRLDSAYVRRVFSFRAAEAGLDGLSPTTLRNFREQELLRQGVPLSAVEDFLGRRKGRFLKPGGMTIFREAFRRWEDASQTRRHNIVYGRLAVIRHGEFSCRLEIRTPAGTVFHVHCSTRTFARLELAERNEIGVFVRSLQVRILSAQEDTENCFAGTVVDILERGNEARVMIRLMDEIQQFCSIVHIDNVQKLGLKTGIGVWVLIRAEDFTFIESVPSIG